MASKPKKQAVRLEPTPQELERQMNELRNFMTQERRQELLDAQRLTPSTPRDLEFERYLAGKATPTFSEASKASQPAFGMYPQMKGKRVFNDREAAANAPLSALRGLASGTLGLAGDVESLGRMAIPNASARTFFPSSEDFQRVMPGRDLTATPTGAAAQFAGNLFADAGIMGTAKAGTAAAKLAGKGVKGLGRLTAEQIAKGMEGSGPLATALAPVSNRYMFIGPKAETWNPSKAEQAVKMEAAGKTPQEIWATTGTFRGADGNLRQEISDKGSQFMFEGDIKGKARAAKEAEGAISDRISESKSIHPDLFPKQLTQAQKDLRGEIRASKAERQKSGGLETPVYRGNLAEIALEHPELYKAYPELADWIVKQGIDNSAFLGSMTPGEINVYKKGLARDPRSTMAHEFQHAVQGLEGWAPGGNPTMAFQDPEAFKILEQLRKEVATPMSFEDYVKKGGYGDDKETLARAREEYKDYVEDVPINAKKYDVDLQRRAAEEYYQRLTGEAESRATQARIDMTPEQRAAKFPAESYDRPQDVLINKPPHENIVPERVNFSDNPDTMQMDLTDQQFQVGGIVKAAKAAKAGKGLYSAVDKAALGLKRPMGTGKEFMAEIKSTLGVKATELKSRSLADIEAMPKMTKDKFIKELEARPPVKIEEKVLGQPNQKDIDALVDKLAYEKGLSEAREFGKYGDDINDMAEENYRLSLKFDKDELEEKAREMLSESGSGPVYAKETIPGGQNYREILLKIPTNLEHSTRYQVLNDDGKLITTVKDEATANRMISGKEGFSVKPVQSETTSNVYRSSHWDDPNVLAHIRVSDRIIPTYTPDQAENIGQRIAQSMNIADANNLGSGAPAMAIKSGAVTPLEAAQYADYRGFKGIDTTGAKQKVLHVEEIQSDWHQAGRKTRTDEIDRLVKSGMSKQEAQAAVPEDYGYSTNMAARRQELGDRYKSGELSLDQYDYLDRELTSVPDAPFKKDWQELALRKVMELAAEGGYDKVALTPGLEQASRYDLSKQIDNVVVSPYRAERGEYTLKAIGKDGQTVIDKNDVQLNELDDYIGKELADKARQQLVDYGKSNMAGVDLKVGGEGMKSFYDKMLPDYLNKLGKQYGVKVEPTEIDTPRMMNVGYGSQTEVGRDINPLHSFEVTPQMRQDITEKGLPLYQQIGVPIGAGAVGAEANDQPVEGMKAGGVAQKSIKDRLAEHRATKERKFQVGGAVKALKGVSAAERAAAGRKAAEMIKAQPQVKASEALGQAREKGMTTTTTTQADRTRVGGGNIGGGAFSAISEADPLYAGKAWGVMSPSAAKRLKNLTTPETAWTTMLGSADQLKSNPIIFAKLEKQFKDAMKEGKLSPELAKKINHNLELTFGEGADIRDPKIWKQADTFDKRAALADLMMGQGLPPKKGGIALGGEKSGKGVIFKPTETLIRETEPTLMHPEFGGDVPTYAAGPRLFTLSGESSFRPDLHPGFPELLEGKDLGYSVKPTPTEVYLPEWHKRFKAANPERKPGYYDLSLGVKGEGLPSQQITDEYIRHLIREGFKEGGAVKKKTKNQRKLDKPRVKISSNPDTMYMELNSKRK